MKQAQTLVVLGTGGTISGRAEQAHEPLAYTCGQLGVDDLLAGLQRPAGCTVEAEQVAQIDSKDMGPAVWRALLERTQHHLQRPEVRGVVITHGTDTLEETAYLLQALLQAAKPVVLTCAMRPATALLADGPQNLQDALLVAAQAEASGVLVVCAGRIHAGQEVQKVHNYRLDAFESHESGPLGVVQAGQVRCWRPWPATQGPSAWVFTDVLASVLACQQWPRVEWLTSHAGCQGDLVRALLAHRPGEGGAPVQGLVVAGTGNGTLHQDLLQALLQAQQQGVTVWRTTRCAQGTVLQGADHPIPVVPLPPAKARLALMLELLRHKKSP